METSEVESTEMTNQPRTESKMKTIKNFKKELIELYNKINKIQKAVYKLGPGQYLEVKDFGRVGPQQVKQMQAYFVSRLNEIPNLLKQKKTEGREFNESISFFSSELVNFFKNVRLGVSYGDECEPTKTELASLLKVFFEYGMAQKTTITRLLSIYNRVNNTQLNEKGKPYKVTKELKKYLTKGLTKLAENEGIPVESLNKIKVTDISTLVHAYKILPADYTNKQQELLKDKQIKEEVIRESKTVQHTLKCLKEENKVE